MRTVFLFSLVFTMQFYTASAQTRMRVTDDNPENNKGIPLVMVDSFKTDIKLLTLNPDNIESVTVFKDSIAIAKFGDAGKYGVIIINPKKNTTLLRVNNILALYKIPVADLASDICINNTLIKHPELILIEQSAIETVEITTDKRWMNVEEANATEKYINIRIKPQGR